MACRMKPYITALLVLSGCGASDPRAAFEPGERGRVVRIIDGDALVLETGQSVRLVGIEAPAPERGDRPAASFADDSTRMLEDMALGRTVRLYYAGLTRDRYDRALAHVFTDDDLGPAYWLNLEMVRRGGARARIYPDTSRGAADLLEAEHEARAADAGLWRIKGYAPLRANELPPEARGFFIIDGVLGEAKPDQAAGCRRDFLNSELTLEISSFSHEACAFPLGARVEARGYVRDGRMEITHRLNIEEIGR